jgi:O-antigen ligase
LSGSGLLKGGLAASLLFCALAVAAWGSANASTATWMLALALLWAGARWLPDQGAPEFSPLAACVFGLATWMTCTNLWANPSYTPAAPYHAAFLLGGFLLGRGASREGVRLFFAAGLVFALCAALWGLWLEVARAEGRAHGVFVTPATFASVLNLLLLPVLVLVACGARRIGLILSLVLLSAGLAAAGSRGGWLAFGAAAAFALILARRERLGLDMRSMLAVATALAGGCGLAWLVQFVSGVEDATRPMTGAMATLSSVSRLELYALALKSIAPSTLLLGAGHQSFYYFMEAGRASVPSYSETTTYFVHNDYLQVLLELGLPGFLALLAIVIAPFVLSWRAVARIADVRERVTLVAAFAAIASMAVHALVDFPFYIPVCLIFYGSALGLVDGVLLRNGCVRPLRFPWSFRAKTLSAARVGVVTLALWVLAVPFVAEAAAEYGQREWKIGHGRNALLALEVARRVDPRDWRYDWYVGQFWLVQAEARGDPVAANLADAAFAKGFAVNPREVRNLNGRVYLHSRQRHLLDAPADPATLRAWAEQTVRLAPLDAAVRAQSRRVMQEFGSRTAPPAP